MKFGQASEPLTTLLNYVTHRYMIDNVILIMTGSMRGRSFTVRVSYPAVEQLRTY